MLWKDGRTQIDTKFKKYGCRRRTTWAGQIISTLECLTITVARTDTAATASPTWPAGSSTCTPSGPVPPPRSSPWRVAPHVPGPDHAYPGSGPRSSPSLLAKTQGVGKVGFRGLVGSVG